jgi:hypothetical protein
MVEQNYHVFESGSGKWVTVDETVQCRYTSDRFKATVFDALALRSGHGFLEDFLIYRRTLYAVPVGDNRLPTDCPLVESTVRHLKLEKVHSDE